MAPFGRRGDPAWRCVHVFDDHNLATLFGLLLVASLTINPAVMVTMQAHVKDELGRSAGDAALPFALMGLDAGDHQCFSSSGARPHPARPTGVGNVISLAGALGFAVVAITYVRNAELRRLS